MRKLLGGLAVAALVASPLAMSSTASAHGTEPTAAACVVEGSVTTDLTHYTFVDSTLECTGTFEGSDVETATYDVSAEGDTQTAAGVPETCAGGTNDGPGSLSATETSSTPAPNQLDGTVEFVRVGPNVVATGHLVDENGHHVQFVAEMQFLAENPEACALGGTINASLTGEATVTDHQHV